MFAWPEDVVLVFSRPTRVEYSGCAACKTSLSLRRKAILVCWIAGRWSGQRVEFSNSMYMLAGGDWIYDRGVIRDEELS